MQHERRAGAKVWVKSTAYVIAFWSLTALCLVGFCRLFNAAALAELIRRVFGA